MTAAHESSLVNCSGQPAADTRTAGCRRRGRPSGRRLIDERGDDGRAHAGDSLVTRPPLRRPCVFATCMAVRSRLPASEIAGRSRRPGSRRRSLLRDVVQDGSTARREATSPALWPPIPSATTQNRARIDAEAVFVGGPDATPVGDAECLQHAGRVDSVFALRLSDGRLQTCGLRGTARVAASNVSASSARLSGPVALHAREAQREPAGILRALLDVVERDLDDQLRPHDARCSRRGRSRARAARPVCHASISSVSPLNVLPSMTKPPRSASRAPRCRLLSQPCAAAVPHSAASTTRSSVRACLILSQPRRAGRPRTARRAPSPSRLRGRRSARVDERRARVGVGGRRCAARRSSAGAALAEQRDRAAVAARRSAARRRGTGSRRRTA